MNVLGAAAAGAVVGGAVAGLSKVQTKKAEAHRQPVTVEELEQKL